MTKLKLFIFICFCALSTITQAQQAPYTLQLSDVIFSDGQINDYTNITEKNIIIPNNFNGVAVTSIGVAAFFFNQLTEVSIPNSVKSIGVQAFYGNQLTEVSIPDFVNSIGKDAFYGNQQLIKVSIGNSVTSIGEGAFAYNDLAEVSIGNSVKIIGEGAFSYNKLTGVSIPNSVNSIGKDAFRVNKLAEVSIGNSVTSIGEGAFSYNKLTYVIIPNSVNSIGKNAFSDNTGLTSFNLPAHYQDSSYPWSNGKKSGDEITDFGLSYVLDEDSKGNAVDFTISYTLDGGTNDANNPANYTIETDPIILVDATKDGYTFESWYSEAAFTNQVTEIATGSTGDVILYAKFDAITYDITYTLDGGTNAANNPADYTVETATITLAEASKDGYTFEGWYSEAAFTNQVTEIATGSTGDVILYAKFDAITYDITYTLDGGTNDANNPADYTVETATITLANASKTGRTFKGWYSDAAFTNQVTEIATGSTGHKEFFAKFSDAITYNITYTLDGGTNDVNNPADYTVETATITLENASKDGYTFEGWYSEAAFTNQVTEIAIGSTGNKEFFAKFSDAITYDITYTLDGGTNDANNPADYTVETATITLADASKDGYTFEGWYSEAAFTNQVTELATGSTGHKEFFAKFSDAITYDITYTLDGGTNAANNPADYTVETATITLADASKDGYTFEGWYSEAVFTNQVTEIATGSTGHKEFFAKFSDAITYNITYTLDGGTNDVNNPADYTVETATITLENASKDGYTFEGWYSDAAFTADNEVTEIATGSTGPKEFFAKFSETYNYNITYNLDGGTNGSNPISYTVKTATITLADASKDGYTFEGWYSEDVFTNQVTEIATGSTGPKEFFAKFSDAITYDITYTLDGGTNDANNPANYTIETDPIILVDATKDGYTFEGWYSDAAFTADNEVTEIATGSTGPKEFFAKFSDAITYNITYTLDGGTNAANNPADYTVETATITLEDASKDGYTFEGWYSDAAFTADNEVTEIATGSTGDVILYAKFDAITYDITYTLDGGTNAANNPAKYTVKTETITLADASKTGRTFKGWYSEAAFTNQVTEIATGSTGDISLYAKYSDEYTLQLSDVDFSDGEITAYTNTTEKNIIIPDNFDGVAVTFIGENAFQNNQLTQVSIPSSVTSIGKNAFSDNTGLTSFNLPAHYQGSSYPWSNGKKSGDEITDLALSYLLDEGSKGDAVDFTISYTLDGGTNDANNPADYTVETATITLADASKDGYTFEGWYSDATFTADNEVTEIATGSTGPKEFFAKFSDAITYDITYTLDGGTNAANNPADYTVETATITLADATQDGYTFEGWYSDAAFTADNEVTEIATGSTEPKEFFAKFSDAITYDITYTLDGGTNDANNPADYTVETATITLADATKDGYTFEGWYSEAAFTNQVTEIATGSTGDVVLFAKYSEIALGIYTTNIKVFNFYPNPSIDFIQTELEVSSLTIRSISGSKVKQFEGGSFFDISNLKSGVYILLAIDKNGDTYKSKLLKE